MTVVVPGCGEASGAEFRDADDIASPYHEEPRELAVEADGETVTATFEIEVTDAPGEGFVHVFCDNGEGGGYLDVLAGDAGDPLGRSSDSEVFRFGGSDRVETAIRLARRSYPTTSRVVVLANAGQWPDALVGGPLAVTEGGPILLTGSDRLDSRVAAEVERLDPERVLLLGGDEALSPAVEAALGRPVERIAGEDRFATAALVAGRLGPSERVFVAPGDDFADALAASASAARMGAPILLVAGPELPAAVEAELRDRAAGGTEQAVLVGGSLTLSQASDAVEGTGLEIYGLVGRTPAETSAQLDYYLGPPADGRPMWLANAYDFPDALTVGPVAALLGERLLLVEPSGFGIHRLSQEQLIGAYGGFPPARITWSVATRCWDRSSWSRCGACSTSSGSSDERGH